ncbi:MAG: hypothetical protein QOE51_4102 [Actinoplanes sp.]|nr:hypothetical protein [Actinoplanes sp.]
MGLLRRVARARLASRVIRRLRRAGVAGPRYHAATFSVRFTAPGETVPTVLELAGLLADKAGSRRERRARQERFVAGFLRTPGLPPTWAQAKPLLRTVLRGSTRAEVGALLHRPALPMLAEFVVVDQPDTMTYVAADQLAGWAVSAAEAFAAARANLTGAVLHGVAAEPVVVQFVDDGDSYWTSHLLLDGWLAKLAGQVGGPPVAFAPERGTLLVTADGSRHLPGLFAQAEEIFTTSARAISPMAYISDPVGRTVPYPAVPGHPVHDCVVRASALLAVHEYGRQAGLLTGAAELVLVDGSRTRARWERNAAVLLPAADEVLVGTTVRAWAEVLPHLTPEPALDPPRWRGDRWP